MTRQQVWYSRPLVIIALLIVLPPAGIVLMWMRLPWARNTKVAISGIAGAWFVAMLLLGNAREGSEAPSTSPNAAATTEAPPARHEPPPAPPPAPTPQPPPGQALIEAEPLLLIPTKLDGFALSSASRLPPKVAVGAAASYYGENKHLVAHVNVNKSDVKPYPPDEHTKPGKVGEHDGLITENASDKTISIEWVTSGWHGLVAVDYERAADDDAARKAVQVIAPQVGTLLDQYLTGSPPSEADRQQQLAAIGRAAVVEFIAKLEREGITNDVVVGAHQDEHATQLLVVTVGPSWLQSTKQERRAAVQKLQAAWADLHSPGDPESSSVKLIDRDSKTVGLAMGSNVTVE